MSSLPGSPILPWDQLRREIIGCTRCQRLRQYCLAVARDKRQSFQTEEYWGLPVPGFGDPAARILIIGLAPAAHGGNRTGRIFTGDRSGDWLYRALFKAGFANQPESVSRDDGLVLNDVFISCINRCAPPGNKPTPDETNKCLPYLLNELHLLAPTLKVMIVLGQLALTGLWKQIGQGSRPRFAHGASIRLKSGQLLLMSYHPSQQNTFTGRLTEKMFDTVFTAARRELSRS
ncbi:MAG TPA: uracil-DNA glycosylase [Bdellovibrionales bacterium]|nr:MAG: hypothetical protein A2Z97_13355 [Bdellovibrionales bacterium GWB1_52_6]OFZ03156.1 MAG: hypothetical protein A2X97_04025 [Bdellovibrionales bacterium GWA1_52_35]OFZ43664.1 MAG: hypothetical protein A2070_04495 [Bdellovibrionales bacterium GWC1_52_8]HAR43336.1 uracil-DNA glycosylase [Bdellovibrionales bacterium]HCM38351.1 uracil-DNA glycosylase [Bdellovibrionales bacterium]